MSWNTLNVLLADGSVTPRNPAFDKMTPFVLMAVMGVVMYVLMIRPQSQQRKRMEALLKSIKPGDKILTGSGIVGVVLSVKEKTLTLRSADTKLEVLKSAVSEVTEKAGASSSES
jgi:preprotein translocase subunit YajC